MSFMHYMTKVLPMGSHADDTLLSAMSTKRYRDLICTERLV